MVQSDFKGKKVTVVGLARSGVAAARALDALGAVVTVTDKKPLDQLSAQVAALGNGRIPVEAGGHPDRVFSNADLIVLSPGVPKIPQILEAQRRGVPVISELELAWLLSDSPYVGITGTNGKSTVTTLVGLMLERAHKKVLVAGNIGNALTEDTALLRNQDWIVAELSSFQLEDIETLRPRIAVLLNLAPDHLDRHSSLEDYRSAKLRIFENQGKRDVAVVPRGFGPIPGKAKRIEFALDDPLPAEPSIPGDHNRENAAAATAAARAAGIDDDAIGAGLARFEGVPHRLELVREVNGVRFVNDSKATNPEAAERALSAYPPGIRLILGGSRKGIAFTDLAKRASTAGVAQAYLIGDSADEIAEALAAAGVRFTYSRDLATAVQDAYRDAEPGEVVLLSPACASYDQFRDFEERGDLFRELVEAL
jgi:UDP-N-acetylmuramoylalanine--D-glutamate ligase